MMETKTCATGTLATYQPDAERPWDRKRAIHFFHRIGFAASSSMIEQALATSPENFISNLMDQAVAEPPIPEPEWGDWAISKYDPDNIGPQATNQIYEWISKWMDKMYSSNPIKAKMTLFWSNHFVTKSDDYNCPSYLYQYHKVLEENCLGNFKNLTVELGKNPAMLVFLNGVQNTKFDPNENYARELFELFTLGRDVGYTQNDITEAARALTGWNGFSEACAAIDYNAFFHDEGEKTIFGRTGTWDYEGLHDVLFEERSNEIALHICGKLYEHFVSEEVCGETVLELAEIFKDNNFEIAPVVKTLLLSDHFFDEFVIGNKVKSPTDMLLGLIKSSELKIQDFDLDVEGYNQLHINSYFLLSEIGQQLFNPPDVAGWQGGKVWVNNNTLTGRWQFCDFILGLWASDYRSQMIDFVLNLSGGVDNDATLISKTIVDHFIPHGLQNEEAYERALTVFKIQIPENYFDDGSWSLYWEEDIVATQIYSLLRHVVRLPEFQLF